MDPDELRVRVADGYHRGLTLQEIGDEIGVTRERVRQVFSVMGLEIAGRQDRRYATAVSGRARDLVEAFLRLRDAKLVAAEIGVEESIVVQFVDREIPDAKVLSKSKNQKTPIYSDDEYFDCLRLAARELSSPMGHAKYAEWVVGRSLPDGRRWPGPQGMMIRFGSWRDTLLRAGLPANPTAGGSSSYDIDDFREAVVASWRDLEKPPTVSEYDSWAAGQDQFPSSATIRKQIDGWDQIMVDAWFQVHADFVDSRLGGDEVSTFDHEADFSQSDVPATLAPKTALPPQEPEGERSDPYSIVNESDLNGEPVTAEWIFDRLPPSKSREGGIAANQVFRANIDTFVREVIQNSLDQAIEGDHSQTVDVRFKLEKSTGSRMQDLLDSVGWETLSEHLEDSERHGGETISGRLREGLELIELGSIRVLTVEDRNTKGLTGSEDGDSNFANLCRNQLVTSSERKESGGSFGIGKSVLWLFSTLSTVLFASRPIDRDGLRFIGRTYLPSHEAFGREWKGPGWFGSPDEDDGQPWAVSMSGPEGDEVASRCGIYRGPEEFGTSILVLGFDDPSQDDEPSVAETCRAIQDSASRWYWPALEHRELTVEIVGTEDGEEVFKGNSSSDFVEVAPFVSAMIDPVSETGDLKEPGDVVEKLIPVKIPAKTNGDSGVVEARARLRLRVDEPTDDLTHRFEVALQRGTGMVVQNYQPRTKQKPALDLRGVLLAGRASGSEREDHALEKFLRASEPPAHNSWDHTTQRLKSDYKTSGRKRAIESVYQQIDDAIGALVDEIIVDSDAVPDFLRKMLPLGGSGAREPKQRSRLKESSGYLVENKWQFEGTFENSRPPAEGWSFRIRVDIDQEGSGKKAVIPIEALEAPGCEIEEQAEGSSLVRVLPGISIVTFSGTTGKVSVFDPRRVKMKLLAVLTSPNGEENEDE